MLFAITYPSIPTNSSTAFLLIPGGPGLGFLTHSPGDLTSLELVNELKRPLILFDPRGTGNASRLNCFLQDRPLSLDYELSDLRQCLSEIGDEILHYSSTAIVKDLELLRMALGFRQFDLLGISYGSLIAQAYGVLSPESVHSMMLDSPLPLRNRDLYQLRRPSTYARIYTEKNKNNPNFTLRRFKKQMNTVLRRLRWNKALRLDTGIDPRLLSHIFKFTPDNFTQAIASAANEQNYSALKEMVQIFNPSVQPLRNFSVAMSISTVCNDFVEFVPWDVNAGFLERKRRLVDDIVANVRLNDYSPFYVTEAFDSFTKYCTAVPFSQIRMEGLPMSRRRGREIPALVLVGDADPLTPLEDIVDLDPALKKNVAIIKGASHVVAQYPCGEKLLREFATQGFVKDISACE
ncbi:unnamed protein product [Agarophyton chilense]